MILLGNLVMLFITLANHMKIISKGILVQFRRMQVFHNYKQSCNEVSHLVMISQMLR